MSSFYLRTHPPPTHTSAVSCRGAPTPPAVDPAHGPRFSFDHVPVFFHVTKTTPFNASELQLLSRAALVTFDKDMNAASMPGASAEQRFAAAAAQVKTASHQKTQTLFYTNGLIDFAMFWGLHNATVAAPGKYLLHNTTGGLVDVLPPYPSFDVTKTAMRELYVQECLRAVQSGPFDGVFVDRANYARRALQLQGGHIPREGMDPATAERLVPGQRLLLANLTAALGATHILLAKLSYIEADATAFQVANAAMASDTFCSNYKSQAHYNATQCRDAIRLNAQYAARGQLTESHGMGPLTDTAQREFTLACFLVSMGKYSYFTYATEDPAGAWALEGTRWWPEYDKPLGVPLGAANVSSDGWVFRRSFSSGTAVEVDVLHHSATITWGSVSPVARP